jgi:hypothetical protein
MKIWWWVIEIMSKETNLCFDMMKGLEVQVPQPQRRKKDYPITRNEFTSPDRNCTCTGMIEYPCSECRYRKCCSGNNEQHSNVRPRILSAALFSYYVSRAYVEDTSHFQNLSPFSTASSPDLGSCSVISGRYRDIFVRTWGWPRPFTQSKRQKCLDLHRQHATGSYSLMLDKTQGILCEGYRITPYFIISKQTPWPLVRRRTIPTDRPPLVDEI